MTYALHAGDPNPEERHNESLQSFQSLSGFLGEGHPKSQTMNNTSQPGSGRLSPLVATLNLRGRTKMNIAKSMYWSEACTLPRQGTRLAPAQLIAEQV